MSGSIPAPRPADWELVQARLRLALDAAQMGLWDWDLVTGELVWDERSAAMYGTTLADSTGTIADVDTRVHPEDLPGVRTVLAGAIDSAGAVDVEFRVIWLDGTVRWIYGRGQALIDASGATVRVLGTNVDVTEQRHAERQQTDDARRRAGLVAVAQALGDTETEPAVLQVVTGVGVSLLGAAGAVLVVNDPARGIVRTVTTGFFADQVQAHVAELPAGFPLPMVDAAVTGTAHFLHDRAAAVAAFPDSEVLYAQTRTEASAAVPLTARGQVVGSLSVAFTEPHVWREPDRVLLEALAALTGQALDRIWARQAESKSAEAAQRLSGTLQRSLLTDPPRTAGLIIAVRYQPAVLEAQVGGDWYDAFRTPDGKTTLVIGDVAGHDRTAAATMAQVRNVLRGVAQTLVDPPAAVLSALDRALVSLQVPTTATAVLCQLDQDQADEQTGGWTLRWSNAGHPPPVLIDPDGHTGMLSTPPDLLLGFEPGAARADHAIRLPTGSTLLLYTDGLVERRGQPLDAGLERLRDTAATLARLPVEQLCDALLEQLAHDADDDIAMLVLRIT